MQVDTRPLQTVLEFLASGALFSAALIGLFLASDLHLAREFVATLRHDAQGAGAAAALIGTATVYAIGVFVDDVTRLVFEERTLDRTKLVRLEQFELDYPSLFRDAAWRGRNFAKPSPGRQFGVMRMFVLQRSPTLYDEVTNQIARMRLARVIVASLATGDLAVLILGLRTGATIAWFSLPLLVGATVAARMAMRERFTRYVRAVERAFVIAALLDRSP